MSPWANFHSTRGEEKPEYKQDNLAAADGIDMSRREKRQQMEKTRWFLGPQGRWQAHLPFPLHSPSQLTFILRNLDYRIRSSH